MHASSMFSALAKSMYTLHWVGTRLLHRVRIAEGCCRFPHFGPGSRGYIDAPGIPQPAATGFCYLASCTRVLRSDIVSTDGVRPAPKAYVTIRFRPKTKINVCDGPQACSDTPVLSATVNTQLVFPFLLAPRLGDSRRGPGRLFRPELLVAVVLCASGSTGCWLARP